MNTIRTLTAATVLALLPFAALAEEVIGVVKRAHGTVQLERAGMKATAAPGTEIQRGDRLITGSDGYASVSMRRAAPLTVGPQNEVTLDRFAAEERPTVKRAPPPILQGLASFFAVNRQR